MRKYFMIGTVMAAMVLTVGCGNGKKEEATTAAATTVAETTVQETTVEETTTAAETTAVEEATTKVKKKTKKKADKGETAIMKKNKEETTEKVTETATEKATKAKSNSNGKSTAKKYIGKNMDELVAAIGKYKSMDKDKSCLEEGEYDGFFYYDGFTVSATTKNGQWIINSVD